MFTIGFLILALLSGAYADELTQLGKVPVCLLHMHDGAPTFQEYGMISLKNKRRYAIKHGYELVQHIPEGTQGLWSEISCDEPGYVPLRHDGLCYVPNNFGYKNDRRAATFGKIKLAQHACVGRENYWLLWMDADALVMNQTLKLEEHLIDDRYDIITTKDWLMMNAGMMLLKCNQWTLSFLKRVYDDKEFDKARALDQSSFQNYIDELGEEEAKKHVKYVPKWAMNVYTEEYRPGDFLLHMAGKLYEAGVEGATALMRQYDALSLAPDASYARGFLYSKYVLTYYSGLCDLRELPNRDCPPESEHRLKLEEPLGAISIPNRYRHVGERYYWLKEWKDMYDFPGWDEGKVQPKPFPPGRPTPRPTPKQETPQPPPVQDPDEEEHEDL
ncbi:hypothetical protein NDN08_001091 [Rhodosorus marinus]|uniref:Nucleotide-diphospho-sugar transferase domain-containing protein n=1 Tax=Rhodosorus marinus TaxID=101924 RepID=A0AAV8USK8_9RHOD|nr:hypothetical protein NDN08_001091 [Rhodosorus marinus]